MSRRQFLRVTGGVTALTALAPNYAMGMSSKLASEGVLLEANSFKNYGGWVLDTQFYQQMGGCYLLAHGMGEPVENASTEVNIPEGGDWHVFVRTRDWCPGKWDAPGQFNYKDKER